MASLHILAEEVARGTQTSWGKGGGDGHCRTARTRNVSAVDKGPRDGDGAEGAENSATVAEGGGWPEMMTRLANPAVYSD